MAQNQDVPIASEASSRTQLMAHRTAMRWLDDVDSRASKLVETHPLFTEDSIFAQDYVIHVRYSTSQMRSRVASKIQRIIEGAKISEDLDETNAE